MVFCAMMQNISKDEDSLPYIKWQLDQLRHQHEYSTELWGDRVSDKIEFIKTLEEKVDSMQKEMKEVRSREEGLSEALNESKETNEKLNHCKTRLEKSVLRYSEIQHVIKKELAETHGHLKVALAEIETLNHTVESLKLNVDEWKMKTNKSERCYFETKHRLETEVTRLNEDIRGLKMTILRNESLIKELGQETVRKEKELQREKRICTKYEESIIGLKNQIRDHKDAIRASRVKFNELVNLHHRLNEKNVALKNKVQQSSHLKPAVRDLQAQVKRITDTNVTVHAAANELLKKNARLEDEKLQALWKEEEAMEMVHDERNNNTELNREIEFLTNKLQVSERDLVNYRNEFRILEAQVKHIIIDLERCMMVIEKPKELRAQIIQINLASQEANSKCSTSVTTTSVATKEAKPLPPAPGSDLILENTRRAKANLEKRLENMVTKFDNERGQFIKLINEQVKEIDDLKRSQQGNQTRPSLGPWSKEERPPSADDLVDSKASSPQTPRTSASSPISIEDWSTPVCTCQD